MHAGRKIVFTRSFYKTELILRQWNTKRTKIILHLYSETVKIIILNYSNKNKQREGDMEDIEYNYQKRQDMFKLSR